MNPPKAGFPYPLPVDTLQDEHSEEANDERAAHYAGAYTRPLFSSA
jgi:hypothetical protein